MHRLRDFKNFESAELNLFAPLTILLGRNGSGKTNLIEGVEIMGGLARGLPFTEITDTRRGGAIEVRGGLTSCPRFGNHDFGLRLDTAEVVFRGRRTSVVYDITISVRKTGVQLVAESLHIGEKVFFHAEEASPGILDVTYNNFAPGPNPRRQMSASSSVLSRYREVAENSKSRNVAQRSAHIAVSSVLNYLRRSYIFDPNPKLMRSYERVDPQAQLARNGANLSAVLFALDNGQKESKTALERITQTIQQIPEEPFMDIGFAETPLGDVMAGFNAKQYRRSNGTHLVEARLLSDGTLRMLAVLTALETVPEASRIVIEEFDNGLHPSRATVLVRYLAETARRRQLNVVLTTHNPAFMNALDDDQLKSVWICHRDDTRGASLVTRLADLDTAVTLGVGGGLGDFVSRGALEKRLAPDFRKKKTEAIQRWIASVS